MVLTVTHSLSRRAGGLFAAVRGLAVGVAGLGFETRVLGLWDEDFAADEGAWAPLPLEAFPAIGPPAFGYAPAMLHALRRLATKRAVIHLHGLWKWPSRACLRVSAEYGVPRIISPHGMLDMWALRRSLWLKRAARVLYEGANLRRAACLCALGEGELRHIRDYGLRNPVALVPNGCDLPPRAAPDGAPISLWTAGRRMVLFLGRIHPKKGLLPLVRAWGLCAQRHPDWCLAVAGPDEAGHQHEVESLATELGLRDQVLFVGPQFGTEKDRWFHHASAFVLPSYSEGFPMAILEAMANRLPVLMTPHCNFPEAVAAGAAVSVEPEPDPLAEALDHLMNLDAGARRAMGAQGRALVERDYTWERVARRMVEVYSWMCGDTAQPGCVVTR